MTTILRRDLIKLAALPLALPWTARAANPLPSDLPPDVKERRIAWWRDQKFGLFLHWGAYSVLGCTESWPLSFADRSWSNKGMETREQMTAFRKQYWDLPRRFAPIYFDPATWARLAQRAGMRYVMFTTKHHDGFAMYDTRQSDYKITNPAFPFARDPRADVVRQVFEAFRAQKMGIGAYFSKPDWHSPDYWDPARWAEDRNPNYDTAAEPARWQRFVRFTHAQIEELMKGYGPIDLIWLDGGQVRPPKQDIQMDTMVAMARRLQPGLLVVNRASKGLYEDYVTPEQEVEKAPRLDVPWETCMTMGTSWSYKPDDTYKSTRALLHLLIDVVAKGGNLLMNVGPRPDGRLPAEAIERLVEIGDWMRVAGEAIHGTRPAPPYRQGEIGYTQREGRTYALVMAEPVRNRRLPGFHPRPGAQATLLGSGAAVNWRVQGADTLVTLPPDAVAVPPTAHAHVFRFT